MRRILVVPSELFINDVCEAEARAPDLTRHQPGSTQPGLPHIEFEFTLVALSRSTRQSLL